MLSEAKLKAIIGDEDFTVYKRLVNDPEIQHYSQVAMGMTAGEGASRELIFVIAMMKAHIAATAHLIRIIHALQMELIEKEVESSNVKLGSIDLQELIRKSQERHNLVKDQPAKQSAGFLTGIRNWRPFWIRS